MAITEEKDGALATAAAAAAAGAAVYGLRKALASGGNGSSSSSSSEHDEDYDYDDDNEGEESGMQGGGMLQSVWESASESFVPLAEQLADAAGKWVAQNSPDLVRDHLIPRFIESFQDAA